MINLEAFSTLDEVADTPTNAQYLGCAGYLGYPF
jgi:hypothetical protein